MNPEKLKELAEELGYEVHSDGPYEGLLVFTPDRMVVHYNPQSNPAQREEVLLWLLDRGWRVSRNLDEVIFRRGCFILPEILVTEKDFTTALMMAAERELG